MYYQEKWINGILCYKINPNDEYAPLSLKDVNKKLIEALAKIYKYENTLLND